MDYETIGLIIAAVVVVYLGGVYGWPYVKGLYESFKLGKSLLESLRIMEEFADKIADIARLICGDKGDEVVDKVESIFDDTIDYLAELDEDEIDIEDTKEYIEKMIQVAGIEVTETEKELINRAIDLILDFIKD